MTPALAPASAAVAAAADDGTEQPALRLRGVTRAHAGQRVWAPVDLSLAAGTLCVLTGANGSGKTTLLRVAAGLLRPSSGSRDCAGAALYLRNGGGVRSAQAVTDAVRSAAALAGRRSAAADAVDRLALGPLARRRVGTLSAGERVRVSLAVAVAVRPALLCLDEPTAALDDAALDGLRTALAALCAGGSAVLLATHQPAAVLPVADAHLRLSSGRLVGA